nr:hypothetical protein [Amylibacter sp.]
MDEHVASKLHENEVLHYRRIFNAAFRDAGSVPGPDDWSTCCSILEVRNTSLNLLEIYRKEKNRLKVQKMEERAIECEQIFYDMVNYLAEVRLE